MQVGYQPWDMSILDRCHGSRGNASLVKTGLKSAMVHVEERNLRKGTIERTQAGL